MSAPPSNYENLHVQAPAASQPPAAQGAAPQQAPVVPSAPQQPPGSPPQAAPQSSQTHRVPLEDRQLSPEETEALLRGVQPEPEQPVDNGDDAEQAQMVGDFFSPQGQLPPALTPEQRQQLAQQQPQQVPVSQGPPQQQQVPVQNERELALQAQNQLLQLQIQQMQQQITQRQVAPTPQPGVQQPAQQQQPPRFEFNVPDQYMHAIFNSEDINVRRMALNGLLSGVADTVAQQVRQDMDTRLQGVAPVVQQQLETHQRRQAIQQDMYGTYPELAPYRQFVQFAAQQIAGNLGPDAWNADVRDAIAERVAPMVPGLSQKVQQFRAQRISQMQAGGQMNPPMYGYPQVPQLPQAPVALHTPQVPGMPYQQPGVGAHGSPVYVRDGAGRVTPYYPQQPFVAGQQNRPGGGRPVDAALQDIWSTLGYS